MKKLYKKVTHRVITALKLVGLTIFCGALVYLAYRFNFTEQLGAYGFALVSFLVYCGLFSYIGIDDAMYYLRVLKVKKYFNKNVLVKLTTYNPAGYNTQEAIVVEWLDYRIVDYSFNYKNDLYFTLEHQPSRHKFFATINILTNGITLVSNNGVELIKRYMTIDSVNYTTYVRNAFCLGTDNDSHRHYINLNNIKLKFKK